MEHTDACPEKCTLCGRSWDNFGHLHIGAHDSSLVVILCLPCVSMLARATRDARRAYDNGGSFFDRFAHQRMEKLMKEGKVGGGMDMPEGLAQQLREIFDNMPGPDDD